MAAGYAFGLAPLVWSQAVITEVYGLQALLVAVKPGAAEHTGTPIVMPNGSLGATSGDDSVRCVMACYPVADPLARFRFMQAHTQDPKYPNAPRLVESHLGYFPDEAAMAQPPPRRRCALGTSVASNGNGRTGGSPSSCNRYARS